MRWIGKLPLGLRTNGLLQSLSPGDHILPLSAHSGPVHWKDFSSAVNINHHVFFLKEIKALCATEQKVRMLSKGFQVFWVLGAKFSLPAYP